MCHVNTILGVPVTGDHGNGQRPRGRGVLFTMQEVYNRKSCSIEIQHTAYKVESSHMSWCHGTKGYKQVTTHFPWQMVHLNNTNGHSHTCVCGRMSSKLS